MSYTKQTWTNGVSPMSAERMTHIESGIYDNATDIAKKANLTDIASPFNFKGSTTYAALPTSGNTNNDTYYCTDKNCNYSWNGSAWFQSGLDETVYEEELSTLKEDLVTVINDKTFTVNSTGSHYFNYIVSSGHSYTVVNNTGANVSIATMTSDQTVVQTVSNGLSTGNSINFKASGDATILYIYSQGTGTVSITGESEDIPTINDKVQSLSSDVDAMIVHPNTIDLSTVKEYYQLNTTGAEVSTTGAPGYYYIGKQKVEAGKTYAFYIKGKSVHMSRFVYYTNSTKIDTSTNDGTVLSYAYETRGGYTCAIVTPENDGYIAIGAYVGSATVDLSSFKFGFGLSDLYDGTYYSSDEVVKAETFKFASSKWLDGKKWYALGDSLTAQGHYTSAVATMTGAECTNYGVGGTPLSDWDGSQTQAMCYRYADMSSDVPDFVTVMGGTNDCYYATIGTVGDTSVSTVAGAIYNIYKGLQEKYPGVPILWMIFPRRLDNRWTSYYEIVKDTLDYWSIPYVDVYKECGFNSWNQSTYFNSGDQIHVNDAGGEVIANLLINGLHKVLPY